MKAQEYVADFILIAKRVLTGADYQVFKLRHLLGAELKLCASRLRIDPSILPDRLTRIECTLGRAFCETEPFALFPLDEYFSSPETGTRVPVSGPLAA